jgi:hypothetical protein
MENSVNSQLCCVCPSEILIQLAKFSRKIYYVYEVMKKYVAQEDSQAKTTTKTYCFDVVLGFCKRASHVASTHHSPHIPHNGEFTACI